MPLPLTAGLFPGQGSHTDGMRELVVESVPDLLEAALELVGEDPFARVAESTRFAQPAIYCASVASWAQRANELQPGLLAGHSLGELTALVAADVFDPLTGLRLAVLRGELMAGCAERGAGGMLAVLGCEQEYLDELVLNSGVALANDNAPGQAVLAGAQARLDEVAAKLRDDGQRVIRLDVAGAFHTTLMQPAVEPFHAALVDVDVRIPKVTVVSCATARPFRDVRTELATAIAGPVRWRETMLRLHSLGATQYVDFGPGRVLARLVRRNLPTARLLADASQERSRVA
jgi:[acyl-carrier-protein] S-malonyltransferase